MKLLFLLMTINIFSAYDSLEKPEENSFVYKERGSAELEQIKQLPDDLYSRAVCNLPIVCVDILLVDTATNTYFLVYREKKPAQYMFWVPGGRMYKGENFLNCAQRKCFEELGISVEAKKVLGVYSTAFSDSSWGCSTHTVNVGVLALCHGQSAVNLDNLHSNYKWAPVFMPAENDYVEKLRLSYLATLF